MTKKKKPGQQPGSMHIDRRARQILDSHVSEGPDDELLNTKQVSNEWLGCSEQKLEIARSKGPGFGPKYVVLSNRQIMYRRKDVRDWLEQRARLWTGEYLRRANKPKRPPKDGSSMVAR